jgi:CheY-like chemotaxis protein
MNLDENKTILIIEDDINMQEALAIILEDEGFNVMRADNGKEALELLEKEQKPGLILLDMVMPVMNGWEFADQYRKRYSDRAPIIVISGAADVGQRAREVQANDFIAKPYVINDMLQMVGNYIQ